jgi:hypothetical protein
MDTPDKESHARGGDHRQVAARSAARTIEYGPTGSRSSYGPLPHFRNSGERQSGQGATQVSYQLGTVSAD